ncbi:hypothetical protein I215_09127 [Galbibacter marinus]|uniref:Uncharacterized protein n=1 Tax=Galbibacter marinus TaxID=555500 RepID=K2Q2X4_9FLAO|nr:hypothetical protein [Galbibacter marinus]EKF55181.1 hypothetical protein I215_09127 [Galbibacter marinus]
MKNIRQLVSNCREGNKKEIKKFIKELESREKTTPLLEAYSAVATAYKAKIALNPLKKIELLNTYKEAMDTIVEQQKSYEIVFLRFMIEKNIPYGLGLSNNLMQDYTYLTENTKEIEEQDFEESFQKFMNKFMELNRLS